MKLAAMVSVELCRIIINESCDEQVIVLREVKGKRSFPIVIGVFEATVIDRIVKERTAPRPLTHDLIGAVIRGLGGKLTKAVISNLKNDTYFAKLVIATSPDGTVSGSPGTGTGTGSRREIEIDARPSDAVALALQLGAPIFVSEKVMNQVARVE